MKASMILAGAVLGVLLSAATGCRRPLFVAGDEFHSVALNTDWRSYQSSDPDGMTAWFFPKNGEERSYRITTSNVRRHEFYLPHGDYMGVVIDYSPEEYGAQEFTGMDFASTALVRATRSDYQPDSVKALFGPECFHKALPTVIPETGLYEVANQPEKMALDTLKDMHVNGGSYGYYIPYKERDTYQENIVVQDFYANPVIPVWKLRIRIFVTGSDYLYELTGSVAGLASGRYLALDKPSEEPCLLSTGDWEFQQSGKNEGYYATTLSTFGILGGLKPLQCLVNGNYEPDTRTLMKEPAVIADWTGCAEMKPEDVRLNLKFLLRDRHTTLYYHYDLGEHVVSYDDELVLRIDLDKDFAGHPDLPYTEPFNGAGFDADVKPWEDGGTADIPL